MIEELGQMWVPVLLTYLVTTAVALAMLVRRSPVTQDVSPEESATPRDDEASS